MNLDDVLRELDPRHDMDRHSCRDGSFYGALRNASWLLIGSGKSMVRGISAGAIVGGSTGAIYGVLSGQPLAKSTLVGSLLGANIGMTADYLQYLIRYSITSFYAPFSRPSAEQPEPKILS